VNRAVFLDRDGVINRAHIRDGIPNAPLTISEFELMPGVHDAMARLRQAGFVLVVITNQPDVARGRTSKAVVEAIHARMRSELPVDDIRVCYHDEEDRCACRKPSPGMLYAAAIDREIRLGESYLVGDRWRDIGAGQRAGCTTVLVNSGHGEGSSVEPSARAQDLVEATSWILAREGASQ
jgi:D-glycero-D-manno-heptose 1,7-bisphosphate phosphatase